MEPWDFGTVDASEIPEESSVTLLSQVDSLSRFQQAKQNEVRELFSLNVAATGSISGCDTWIWKKRSLSTLNHHLGNMFIFFSQASNKQIQVFSTFMFQQPGLTL